MNLINIWERCWMRFAGLSPLGRIASYFAALFAPTLYGRSYLSQMNRKGFFSSKAVFHHDGISFGANIFIGDNVVFFKAKGGGTVKLDDQVHIYGETSIQTGVGGFIEIGKNSHIHPKCQLSAYKSGILIGSEVQIAPNCAFYPYNHGIDPGVLIQNQPLESKGNIVIDDDAWLGFGVIVLDGVHIGKGAVIGAGSVVSKDIPDGAIAFGVPARVVKMRSEMHSNEG